MSGNPMELPSFLIRNFLIFLLSYILFANQSFKFLMVKFRKVVDCETYFKGTIFVENVKIQILI